MNLPVRHTLRGQVLSDQDSVRVVGRHHPLKAATIDVRLPSGNTARELIDLAVGDDKSGLTAEYIVCLDGDRISPPELDRVRPPPGSVLTFSPSMRGGLDARTIALLGVAVLALVVSGGAFGLIAVGTWSALAAAGIAIGGSLAINALFPVAAPQEQLGPDTVGQETAFTISGARNTADPFGPIPSIFGRVRVWPRYAAQPYTQFHGEKQILRLLFCLGYGPLSISELKIGETDIDEYVGSDLQYEVFEGYPEDGSSTLYPGQVFQDQLNIELTNAASWQTRTTADDIDEIQVDITAPQGFYEVDQETGKRIKRRVRLQAEYSPTGANTWQSLGEIDEEWRRPKTIVWSMSAQVPRGQYDVRVRKRSQDFEGAGVAVEQLFWVNLTGLRNDPPINFHKPIAIVAMVIKATGQLNSVIDSFNCVVERKMLAYQPDSPATESPFEANWVDDQTSRNPADQFLLALTGPDLRDPEPLENIDLQSLANWHPYCVDQGWEFNYEQTTRIDAYERLKMIAAAGRARVTRTDGLWGVIWDEADVPVAQHFTPRNSWGFNEQRVYFEPPHALRINFINEEVGYQPDERRVYADGYDENNATRFESMELPGVTHTEKIWRMGRFQMAQSLLRPSVYTLETSWQAVSCFVGARVWCAHDVTLWGLKQGRVKSVNGELITLDEEVVIEDGKSYAIRFRQSDGTSVLREVASMTPGVTRTLELVTESPEMPTPDEGALAMFGEASLGPAVLLRVKDIEWLQDFRARLTLVDDAPEISEADQGPIPPYDPHITAPSDLFLRAPVQVTVTERVYVANGSVRSDAQVSWLASALRVTYFEVEFRDDNIDSPMDSPVLTPDWQPAGRNQPNQLSLTIEDLIPGTYSFRVRTRFDNATLSEWVEVEGVVISGVAESESPDDLPPIENFPSAVQKLIQQVIVSGDISVLIDALIEGSITSGDIAAALANKQDVVAWLTSIVGSSNAAGLRTLISAQLEAANLNTIAGLSALSSNIQTLLQAADYSAMRTALSLVPGTNVQAFSSVLSTYAGINPSANVQSILGGADYSAIRTLMSLVPGTNVQAFSSVLSTYAGISPSANVQSILGGANYAAIKALLDLEIGTDVQAFSSVLGTYAGINPSANVQSILGGANYAAIKALLDLEIGTDIQAFSSVLGTYAGISPSANIQTLLGSADFSAARTNLGLAIGTNVQAFSAVLSTYAGINPSANVQAILGGANYAAIKALLDLEIGTDIQAFSSVLSTYSGISPSANIQTLLGSADFSAARSNLGLAIGSNVQAFSSWLADIAAAIDAPGTRALLGAGPLTWEEVTSARTVNGTNNSNITISANAAPGDVAFFFDYLFGSSETENYVPDGFELIIAPTTTNRFLSYKILEEGDPGTTISAAPDADSTQHRKVMFVFRPSRPIIGVEVLAVDAVVGAGATTPITLSVPTAIAPALCIAFSTSNTTAEIDFSDPTPDFAQNHISSSNIGVAYKLFNGEEIVDCTFASAGSSSSASRSIVGAFLQPIEAGGPTYAREALSPLLALKQDVDAWLTSIVGSANAAGLRTLISAQLEAANLTTLSGLSALSSNIQTLLQAADYAAMRTALSLVPGTNVQAFSSVLSTYAGISPSANVQAILGAASFSSVADLLASPVQFESVSSTASVDGEIPAGIRAGDILLAIQWVQSGSNNGDPSGWSSAIINVSSTVRLKAWTKISDGTETSFSAQTGTNPRTIIAAFRPSRPISAVTANDVDSQATSSAPTNQTITASGATGAAIVIGIASSQNGMSGGDSEPGFSPDDSSTLIDDPYTAIGVRFKIYNSSPVNVTVSQADYGSNNVLASFYLTATPESSLLATAGHLLGKQDASAILTTYAGINPSANIQSLLAAADFSAARTSLGLAIGTNVQAFSSVLSTYAGISPSSDVQAILGAASHSAVRTALSLVPGSNIQAFSSVLSTYAGISPSANIQTLLGSADFSAARTNLGLAIGSNVQAFSSVLSTYAGISPSANVQSILGSADYSAIRGLLDVFDESGVVGEILAALSPLQMSVIQSASAQGNITISASAQPGDVVVYFFGTNASHTDGNPGNFTDEDIIYNLTAGSGRRKAWWKYVEEGEPGTALGGGPSVGGGRSLVILHPSRPLGDVTVESLDSETTNGNPAAQVVTSGDGFAPLLVCAQAVASGNLGTDEPTFDPSDDSVQLSPAATVKARYTLFNDDPVNITTDMDDRANENTLVSFYLQFHPAVVDTVALTPLLAGKQDLDAWLTEIIGSANAAGLRSLISAQELASNLTTLAGLGSIANLSTLAGLSALSANIQSLLQAADYSAARTALSLVPGTNVQAFSSVLSTYAGINPSSDVQAILGAANHSAVRTALSLVPGTNVQAFSSVLSTYAGITPSANVQSILGGANYAAIKALLDLEIGTDVQAFSSVLGTYAGISPSANVQSILGGADYSAIRGLLDLESGTDFPSLSQLYAALSPLTLEFVSYTQVAVGPTNLTIPSDARVGDLMVFTWQSNSSYTDADPASGTWKPWFAQFNTGMCRRAIMKLVEAGEPGTDIDLQAAAAGTGKRLLLFRPSRPISDFTINDIAQQNTSGNPTAQTINASGAVGPVIVLAYAGSSASPSGGEPTFTPDDGSSLSANSSSTFVRHIIYNTGSVDVTTDMADRGNNNTLASCYVTFTPQIDDIISLAPQLAGKQDLDAWLTSIAGSLNAAGLRSLISAQLEAANLNTIAGLSALSSNIQTLLQAADYSAMRTALSLVPGTNVQAFSSVLSTYAGINPSANVQSILGGADYSAIRTLMSLVPGTNVQAFSSVLSTYAGISPSANVQSILGGANYAAIKALLDLEIGTDVQAFSSVLGTYAGINPSANIQSLLGSADYSAARTNLGLAIGTDVAAPSYVDLLTRFLNQSFIFIGGDFNTGTTVTLDDGVEADELLVCINWAVGTSLPSLVTPSGFTNFINHSESTFRVACSWKKAVGTEGGDVLTGMDGTGTGSRETICVLRFKIREAWSSMSWDTGTTQATTGNPSPQVVDMANATAPAIGFAIFACGLSGSLSAATAPPSISSGKSFEYGEINGGFTSGQFYILGVVQGDHFKNWAADVGDGGDFTILQTFWGQLVP